MNPTVNVSAGVTLIALAGGVFLLAKIMKDNLGIFYRILAWFIIIACFLNFACMAVFCAVKFWGRHYYMNHEMIMHEKFMKDGMMHGYDADGMMMYHHGDGGGMMGGPGGPGMHEKCCGADGGSWKKCCEGSKDSCARPGADKR